MKKFYTLLVFLFFATLVFSQELKDPRIVSTKSTSYYNSGDYILFVDLSGYVKISNVEIREFKNITEKLDAAKWENKEQQREIDELKRTISNLERKLDEMERDLYNQKRQIEDLQRKVK